MRDKNIQCTESITTVVCYVWVYCRIRPEGRLNDAERDLLAIAKFLVVLVPIMSHLMRDVSLHKTTHFSHSDRAGSSVENAATMPGVRAAAGPIQNGITEVAVRALTAYRPSLHRYVAESWRQARSHQERRTSRQLEKTLPTNVNTLLGTSALPGLRLLIHTRWVNKQ